MEKRVFSWVIRVSLLYTFLYSHVIVYIQKEAIVIVSLDSIYSFMILWMTTTHRSLFHGKVASLAMVSLFAPSSNPSSNPSWDQGAFFSALVLLLLLPSSTEPTPLVIQPYCCNFKISKWH
jgi:hypothetical protein